MKVMLEENNLFVFEYRYLAKITIMIFLVFTLLFYLPLNLLSLSRGDYISPIIIMPFFLFILKYLESFLIFKISISRNSRSILFQKTYKRIIISNDNIKSWGVRGIKIWEGKRVNLSHPTKYLEFIYKTGGKFIYPVDEFSFFFNHKYEDLIVQVQKTLKTSPIDLRVLTDSYIPAFIHPKKAKYFYSFLFI